MSSISKIDITILSPYPPIYMIITMCNLNITLNKGSRGWDGLLFHESFPSFLLFLFGFGFGMDFSSSFLFLFILIIFFFFFFNLSHFKKIVFPLFRIIIFVDYGVKERKGQQSLNVCEWN